MDVLLVLSHDDGSYDFVILICKAELEHIRRQKGGGAPPGENESREACVVYVGVRVCM